MQGKNGESVTLTLSNNWSENVPLEAKVSDGVSNATQLVQYADKLLLTGGPIQAPDFLDADGNSIIGDGGGGGIPDAPADSAIYGRKNNDWVVVPTSGGGDGPDMGLYYTASQCDTKFQPKGSYAAANHSHSNYAAKSHTHSEYQPKGDYLTSFTESDPTVPSHVKNISTADIDKWNNPPGGSGYDGADAVKLTGDQSISGVKTFTQSTIGKNHYFTTSGTVGVQNKSRIAFDSNTTMFAGESNANYIQITPTSAVTNKSFTVNQNMTVGKRRYQRHSHHGQPYLGNNKLRGNYLKRNHHRHRLYSNIRRAAEGRHQHGACGSHRRTHRA